MLADDALDEATDPAGMRLAITKLSQWLGRATEEGRAALNSLRASVVQRNDPLEAIGGVPNSRIVEGRVCRKWFGERNAPLALGGNLSYRL